MTERVYIGNLIVSGSLNAKNGEFIFHVGSPSDTRVIEGKCLYDCLSQYGIDYEKAKELVLRCSNIFEKKAEFKIYSDDLYKKPPVKYRAARKNE